VLLDMGRQAEAAPLLARAQQLSDSLKLGIMGNGGDIELDATWARYYTARGEPARAEKAWLTAYDKARGSRSVPLRLAYLRALADFYTRQGQPALGGRYARTALALSDSLGARQASFNMAGYEAERAGQAQEQRIAALRLAQVQDAARARRQRYVLWATLAGLAGLAGLGFVLWRSGRKQQQANILLNEQKAEIQAQRDQTTQALTELKSTQAQLIQSANMASLGELTAGIAHEIQNPLNFVNNFADVSTEMMTELQEALAARDTEEALALAGDVSQNLSKIHQHGQRAASIVRGMLEHSRQSTGERSPTDINALADEYLRLAYQGLRAKDKSFNATLHTDFAPALPLVPAVGADLGRVLLNLLGNAFYAVRQRQKSGEAGYQPTVRLSTRQQGNSIEIRVTDNGTGIPAEVQAKIFQPFFTTKPTGEGTGLGLSLSYDIITKGHGGSLSVESQPGQGTTFSICLPAA
jgi:signal transduction histidine kinase